MTGDGGGDRQQKQDEVLGQEEHQRNAEVDQPAVEQEQSAGDDGQRAADTDGPGLPADDEVFERRHRIAQKPGEGEPPARRGLAPGGVSDQALGRGVDLF